MAVYSVEGRLGTGKTKFAVWQAQLALKAGRRVASNVDLHLDKLCGDKRVQSWYVRIPDKPSAFDLEAIGHGNPESYNEDRNGVLILDELGTWLNSRQFQDKGRAGLLDWLIHARKLGWDVYLIVQDSAMIDRQVRDALIEYRAKCLRMDKVKIPLLGGMLNDAFGGRVGYLPRMHLVAARIGEGANAVVAERWSYRGDWLHDAYDTRQIFRADYPLGAHCVLHPGRFTPPVSRPSFLSQLRALWRGSGRAPARPEPRPKLPAVAALLDLPADQRIKALRELQRAGVV